MDQNRSNQQSRSFSFRAALEELFLRERDPYYIILILVGITLVGLVLRLLDINKPIAYDEAYTFINFASKSFKHILADYSAPNNHIFHTILVGIAYRLFGGQAWVLRLPALIAGTLMIPAVYFTARRFFSAPQALGAATLMAVMRPFINYSVNGRGYTLLILLALSLANFAGVIVNQQSKSASLAFILTTALGFYTIPIFLYPWAGISLWVVTTYLFDKEPWQTRIRRAAVFAGICIPSALLVLLLYSPVIFFGSGLSSITSNDIVKSQNWGTFFENLDPRVTKTWSQWMIGVTPAMKYLLSVGFLLSLFLYRKIPNQKLPLQIFLALAVAILLLLQRVTPLPRIWLYLEAFYLMFAAAGLVWLFQWLLSKVLQPQRAERISSFAILLILIAAFINILLARQQNPALLDRDRLPEEYAANYLADHLKPEDTIVATGPVDIQAAYYLSLHGISFDRFYQRDHPVEIQHALVMLRKNSQYKTPEAVLNFFKLDQVLDLAAAKLVFEYANVQIYSVPAK
ncbi:MAG TPA: glycosyltransferase family 39 protein [Anaerolineales bacterium]|nr:glycosyltransferase family 39 protein [Anaerolineales bacterium]